MSRISEKVAYLDGLMEGLEIEDAKQKKLFNAIIDALDSIAEELSDHDDAIEELNDSIDEIYDDMDDYDEILYGGTHPASLPRSHHPGTTMKKLVILSVSEGPLNAPTFCHIHSPTA